MRLTQDACSDLPGGTWTIGSRSGLRGCPARATGFCKEKRLAETVLLFLTRMIALRDLFFPVCSSRTRHGIVKGRACGATPLLTATRENRNSHYAHSCGTNKQTNKQRMAGASSIDWIPGGWVAGVQLKPSFLAPFTIFTLSSLFPSGCLRSQPYSATPQSLGHEYHRFGMRGEGKSHSTSTRNEVGIARHG